MSVHKTEETPPGFFLDFAGKIKENTPERRWRGMAGLLHSQNGQTRKEWVGLDFSGTKEKA